MYILKKSKIESMTGNFETGTDFTIDNLADDDIGVYAKSSYIEDSSIFTIEVSGTDTTGRIMTPEGCSVRDYTINDGDITLDTTVVNNTGTVQDNGTDIGTISITPEGNYTWTDIGGYTGSLNINVKYGGTKVLRVTLDLNDLSALALLNINSYKNILKIYKDGDTEPIVDMVIDTTTQRKALFEFPALYVEDSLTAQLVLITSDDYVTVGEIMAGHFSEFGEVNSDIEETPIFQENNYVELDNGSKYYFYGDDTPVRYSIDFTNVFLTRAAKLSFQAFIGSYKKRNMLVKLSQFPEHLKFGKIEDFSFSTVSANVTECGITLEEVI